MTTKALTKSVTGLAALKALQSEAVRKGLDQLSTDEIDAEIAAHRRTTADKRKPARKPGK